MDSRSQSRGRGRGRGQRTATPSSPSPSPNQEEHADQQREEGLVSRGRGRGARSLQARVGFLDDEQAERSFEQMRIEESAAPPSPELPETSSSGRGRGRGRASSVPGTIREPVRFGEEEKFDDEQFADNLDKPDPEPQIQQEQTVDEEEKVQSSPGPESPTPTPASPETEGEDEKVAGPSSKPPTPTPDSPKTEGEDKQVAGPSPKPTPVIPSKAPTEKTFRTAATAGTGKSQIVAEGEAKAAPAPEAPVVRRSGAAGIKVDLKTNYLRLRRRPGSPGMVEYHVTFLSKDAPLETTSLRKRMLTSLVKQIWPVRCFDGMVLILPHLLEEERVEFCGPHPNVPEAEVTAVINFVKVRTVRDCLQFYNNLIRRACTAMELVELRREYYDLHAVQYLRQHKLEIWPGKNMAVENQEDGLMMWIDSCSRVLQEDTVYHYYTLITKDKPKDYQKKFEDFVIGKIVLTRYNNKCYRIDSVDWEITPASTFTWRDQNLSFVQYLTSQYKELSKTKIDESQPMLISKLKPRKNAQPGEFLIAALVPQLCNLTGLFEEQRNNFKVMTDLAASTRLTPVQRMKSLQDFINALLGNARVNEIFEDWGLELDKSVIEINGRVLDGPTLKFNERVQEVKAGPDFTKNATSTVLQPIEIRKYVILCTARDQEIARNFMDMYRTVCRPIGIRNLEEGKVIPLQGMQPHHFVAALNANCDPNTLQFVIIIMPTQRDDVYSAIKRSCVASKPIPSQCVLSKTLSNQKRLRSVVLKIAMQINCKLGGALWALKMPTKSLVMFVGIDAAHDPKKKDASVICLIASMNNECTRYFSKSATSRVHEELGNHLNIMMRDALAKFHQFNGQFPTRIVVYRDGGSLGAMEVIDKQESDQLREAIRELCPEVLENGDYTFVLVTKRIPQRFILEQRKHMYANPAPGTVVDSVVTRRHLYDFYIVSQQVREGTVNPTHCIILDAGDKVKPDVIQKMTYATCFMYYNWTGTVRVPAVVQYAHKLAALLIRHVKTEPHRDVCTTLYYL